MELITEAARDRLPASAIDAATEVGYLIAEMHAALAGTAAVASHTMRTGGRTPRSKRWKRFADFPIRQASRSPALAG